MEKIYLPWQDFKNQISCNNFLLNYITKENGYEIFCVDRHIVWYTHISEQEQITEFENGCKSKCNKSIYDTDGKEFTRAESRPKDCTTIFTTCGDTVGQSPSIGTGTRLSWDASIDTFTTNGIPSGFKRKAVEIQFCDSVWIKEGSIYYQDVLKNSYLDMFLICPNGGYYMYQGQIYQNTTGNDLVVDHYVVKHPIQGSVAMGDELNTEACSQEMPNYMKIRMEITVPESDTSSYGYMEIELYRKRTVVL